MDRGQSVWARTIGRHSFWNRRKRQGSSATLLGALPARQPQRLKSPAAMCGRRTAAHRTVLAIWSSYARTPSTSTANLSRRHSMATLRSVMARARNSRKHWYGCPPIAVRTWHGSRMRWAGDCEALGSECPRCAAVRRPLLPETIDWEQASVIAARAALKQPSAWAELHRGSSASQKRT